jgi:hypothetical protein
LRAAATWRRLTRLALSKGNSFAGVIASPLTSAGAPGADYLVSSAVLSYGEDDDQNAMIGFTDKPLPILRACGVFPVVQRGLGMAHGDSSIIASAEFQRLLSCGCPR